MSGEPIVIGIHGLANKPEPGVLKEWWKASISEGVAKNENIANPNFDFEMVYWANHLYKNPLHDDANFDFDELYNSEPYVEAVPGTLKSKDDGLLDDIAIGAFDIGGGVLDFMKKRLGINRTADAVLGSLLKDLNLYYDDANKRTALRNELKTVLLAASNRKIMLVAHSMGTIIAYDVLTLLGQTNPEFEIDHFVTIGSPLGLPHVKGKIVEEFVHRGEKERDRIRTPSVVKTRWVNFADRKDPVALDVHLSDDYLEHHGVQCTDDLVHNDYRIKKPGDDEPDRNHHKSYGYLRTPEISAVIKGFLTGD